MSWWWWGSAWHPSSWWQSHDTQWQSSTWWRDPEFDAARESARAVEQFGEAQQPGAASGTREGHQVANYPRAGQTRGVSGTAQEKFAPEETFRVDVPVNLKECGFWFSEMKDLESTSGCHITYWAKSYSKKGPGWYTLTCAGPGGHDCIEECLKALFKWRPDLDIDCVKLPDVDTPFPTTAVMDALNNVREYLIRPPQGVTLVSADSLDVNVSSSRGEDVVRTICKIHAAV